MSAGRKTAFDVLGWARNAAYEHKLTRGQAHTLLLLASHADGEGRLFASVRVLASEACTSERTIGRDLAKLRRKGLIGTGDRYGADRRRSADRWLAVPWSPYVEPAREAPHDLPVVSGLPSLYDRLGTAHDPSPVSGPTDTSVGSYPTPVSVPNSPENRHLTRNSSDKGNVEDVGSSNEGFAGNEDWELASDEEEALFARASLRMREEAA